MHDYFLTPTDMNEYAHEAAEKKASHKISRLLVLAILGGAYVGFGGMFANMVASGSLGVLPYGLVKTMMGLAFSLGLILIVLGGAELFTGSTTVALAVLNKKVSFKKMFKNWGIVYFGNFIGSILVVFLVMVSQHYQAGAGVVGKTMFTTALGKLHYGFWQALVLGVLCNIFVCLAIWLSYSTKQAASKILSIVFPITAFVALGFEHCVANMYSIPVAFAINYFNPAFVAAQKIDISTLTLNHFIIGNLIPVTLGNIIGGLVVWLSYRFAYKK